MSSEPKTSASLGRTAGVAVRAALIVLLCMAAVEAGLRVVPSVIPIHLLLQFDAELRGAIAARLGYPAERTTKYLQRDDGGPPLWLTMPGQVVRHVVGRDEPEAVPSAVMDWNGFCNPPDRNRPDYQTDIVTIGDSFTWCLAVRPEDTWTSRMGDLTGRGTYNLSRPAIGPYEYVQLLRAFAIGKWPKIVIINIYEGNDLRDAHKFHRFRSNGSSRPTAATGPRDDRRGVSSLGRLYFALLDGWGGRNSYALSTLLTVTNDLYLKASAAMTTAHQPRDPAVGDAAPPIDFRYRVDLGGRTGIVHFNPDNTDTDEVVYARLLQAGEVGVALFDAALDDIARLARLHGLSAILTYTPSAYTVYATRVRFDDPSVAEDLKAFSDRQRHYFAERTEALGLGFVDTTAALQAAAATDRLTHFPVSLHLTRYGHDVVARAIVEKIFKEGALQSDSRR